MSESQFYLDREKNLALLTFIFIVKSGFDLYYLVL
jgi:hypothetical protein